MRNMLCALLTLTAMQVSAQGWQKPVISPAQYQPLTAGKTFYLLNTGSGKFATQGNEYHTHLSVADTGLKVRVNEYVLSENEGWDGITYTLTDSVATQGAWKEIFFENYPHMYVDRYNQPNYYFNFEDFGGHEYGIFAADCNPDYKHAAYRGEEGNAYVGHNTQYVPFRDKEEEGTGVQFGFPQHFEEGTFLYRWAFISEQDYAEYQLRLDTYTAAVELGQFLAQAEEEGLDCSEAAAVYGDTESTQEQIVEALNELKRRLSAGGSLEQPRDVTDMYLQNAGFEESFTGWTSTTGARNNQLQTNASVGAEASVEGAFSGKFWENWSSGAFKGKMYASVGNLPNGVYRFSLSAFANNAQAAYVYAGDDRVAVTSGTGDRYEVLTLVNRGVMECGLELTEAKNNWVGVDNACLLYYGQSDEALMYWFEETDGKQDLSDIHEFALDDELADKRLAVRQAAGYEGISQAIADYKAVLDRIAWSKAVYARYLETCLKAAEMVKLSNLAAAQALSEYMGEYEATYFDGATPTAELEQHTERIGELMEALEQSKVLHEEYHAAFLQLEEALGAYAESAAYEVLEAAMTLYVETEAHIASDDLTDEEIQQQLEAISEVIRALRVPVGYEDASDEHPFDMTKAIVNPSYDNDTNEGWEGSRPGRAQMVGAAEFWNCNFDMYQDLTGLPNGIYRLSVQGFYRAGWPEAEVLKAWQDGLSPQGAFLYAESGSAGVSVPLKSVWEESYAEAVGVGNEKEVEGIFTPSDMAAAVGYFEEGRFVNSLIVKVENGTLRIGLRKTQPVTADWTMFDDFTLTYYGKDSQLVPTGIVPGSLQSRPVPVAFYTLDGVKHQAPVRGVNLVMYSDGTHRRVMY